MSSARCERRHDRVGTKSVRFLQTKPHVVRGLVLKELGRLLEATDRMGVKGVYCDRRIYLKYSAALLENIPVGSDLIK